MIRFCCSGCRSGIEVPEDQGGNSICRPQQGTSLRGRMHHRRTVGHVIIEAEELGGG
jgi:hypothetical protein